MLCISATERLKQDPGKGEEKGTETKKKNSFKATSLPRSRRRKWKEVRGLETCTARRGAPWTLPLRKVPWPSAAVRPRGASAPRGKGYGACAGRPLPFGSRRPFCRKLWRTETTWRVSRPQSVAGPNAEEGRDQPQGGRAEGKGVPSFHSSETNLSEDWWRSVAILSFRGSMFFISHSSAL